VISALTKHCVTGKQMSTLMVCVCSFPNGDKLQSSVVISEKIKSEHWS